MPSLRFVLVATFVAAFGFGIHNASAFEVDNAASNNPSANLADPDKNTPVAHADDDGTMQNSSGFHLQMQGGDPTAFGYAPGVSHSGPNDAFGRAQLNQMQ